MTKVFYSAEPAETESKVLGNKKIVFIRKNIQPVQVGENEGYSADEYVGKCPKSVKVTKAWIASVIAKDAEKTAEEVRARRNRLLELSDPMMVSDRPTDKEAWAAYRQALRDITKQAGFPYDVEFPTKP